MARILVTGSSDGIGQRLAQSLVAQGHSVILHARNTSRGETAMAAVPGAEDFLIGDLSSIAQMKALAAEANRRGVFDTVIHNAGVGYEGEYQKTEDGLVKQFAVNALAPYVLTALMERPKTLVYMTSSLQADGDGSLNDVGWTSGRKWNGMQAYCDSKLYDVMLAFAVARHWPSVSSNAMDPGWVATKMGGSSASGSMEKTMEMGTRLAIGNMQDVGTGKFFVAQGGSGYAHAAAQDVEKQEKFLKICEELSGVKFPRE